MQLSEIKPQFVLVMGGAGSGKNTFISRNYPRYKLIDVDALKGTMGLSAAMTQMKPLITGAFSKKENVAHPTTGSNLLGQQNKIKLAKQYGYTVILVFIDTSPALATAQVRNRVRQGGHDVELDMIVSTNQRARENFNELIPMADATKVVKNN